MQKSAARLTETFKRTSENMSAAFSRVDTSQANDEVKSLRRQLDNANVSIERHKSKVNSLQERYNAIMTGEIKLDSIARLERKLAVVEKEYAAINKRRNEIRIEWDELKNKKDFIESDPQELKKANARVKEMQSEHEKLGRIYTALTEKATALRTSLDQLSNNPELTDEAIVLSERIAVENAQIDALTNKVEDLSDSFENVGNEASEAFEKASDEVEKTSDAFEKVSDGAKKTAKHTGNAGKGMKQFASRLKSIVAGAFVFNVISAGLTGLRKQMSATLKKNSAITNSLALIKGNLLTAFQPIYEAVLPALQAFMNVLARVSAYLASFTNMLFGKSVSASQTAAKALYEQADATKKAGDAANEALGSYDKLNVISQDIGAADTDTAAGSIVPDFSTEEQSSGLLTNIAEAIKGGDPEKIGKSLGDLLKKGVYWLLDSVERFLDADWSKVGTAIGHFIIDTAKELPEITMKVGKIILDVAKAGIEVAGGVGMSFLDWLEEDSSIELYDHDMSFLDSMKYVWDDLKDGGWKKNAKEYLKALPEVGADIGDALFQKGWKAISGSKLFGIDLEEIYGDNWHDALDKFVELWNSGWSSIPERFTDISGSIGGWLQNTLWENGIKKFFTVTLPDFFTQKIPEFWNGLWSGVTSFFSNVGDFFKEAWESIKKGFCDFFGIHSPSTLFKGFGKNLIEGLKNGITERISAIKNTFLTIWENIKNVFSNVSSWFGNVFGTAGQAVKNAFGSVGTFFGGVWKNIKGAFGNVGNWFRNTFSLAWKKVKEVFSSGGRIFSGIKDGILNGLKAVVNALITGINKVIAIPFNGINDSLQKIRDISIFGNHPFSGIKTISVPQIPKLATGAVIPPNREFMAVLGDQKHGNNIEAPETLIRKIVKEESGGTMIFNLTSNLDGEVVYRNMVKYDRKHKKQFGTSQFA